MKKRIFAIVLSLTMVSALIAGCGSSSDETTTAAETEAETTAAETEAETTAAETEAETTAAEASGAVPDAIENVTANGEYTFQILVKSYQSTYWQAAVGGVEDTAAELGVTAECTGPNSESDIADQVNMLNSAINSHPDGIGLAANDVDACLDALQTCIDEGIPVVCFDSAIPNAPEGSVYATIATNNYAAGGVAADHLYEALSDVIANATAPVRIGEVNQEATSESITGRGLGFIDRIIELATADGKTVAVTGNEYYVNNCSDAGDESTADIIIEVAVPAQTTVELCATEASVVMNKEDTIGMYGSNQVAAEGILTADTNLGVLGSDAAAGDILAAGFDSGTTIKSAITNGTMIGAVTQSPLSMGELTVKTLTAIANGDEVSDILTDGYWYDTTNMDDESIAPNLYD